MHVPSVCTRGRRYRRRSVCKNKPSNSREYPLRFKTLLVATAIVPRENGPIRKLPKILAMLQRFYASRLFRSSRAREDADEIARRNAKAWPLLPASGLSSRLNGGHLNHRDPTDARIPYLCRMHASRGKRNAENWLLRRGITERAMITRGENHRVQDGGIRAGMRENSP